MKGETLIQVEGIKKRYCRSLNRSMLYGIKDIYTDLLGLHNQNIDLRKDEFWSVKDISFELKRGECLGVIGDNGAGKSTLLKMLNGIILPDVGKVSVKGNAGALIEVGAGFHPMLSGRENIYINGSILGMKKVDIDRKFTSIVEFAELEDSIDMPIKHYSSGMYVRLGFAIAAHVKLDILILDEVLAVGDIAFVAKCFRHLSEIKNDTAIILVTHDMRNVSRFCDKAMLLHKGENTFFGEPAEAISKYRKIMSDDKIDEDIYESEYVQIKDVENKKIIKQNEDFIINIKLNIKEVKNIVVNIAVHREDGVHCFGLISDTKKIVKEGGVNILLELKKISLMPGNYNVTVVILQDDKLGLLARRTVTGCFTVIGQEDTLGVYLPDHDWHVE